METSYRWIFPLQTNGDDRLQAVVLRLVALAVGGSY
jgi:hypothetical protein